MAAFSACSAGGGFSGPPFRVVSVEARADGLSDGCIVPVQTQFDLGPIEIPSPSEFVVHGWSGNETPGDPCSNVSCQPSFSSSIAGSRDRGSIRMQLISPVDFGPIISCEMNVRLEEPANVAWTFPTVIGWGSNTFAQIPPQPLGPVKAIDASVSHSLAIRHDGVVLGWGQGAWWVPDSAREAVSISAGLFHSMAARTDGTVICWGSNYEGVCDLPTDLGPAVAVAAGIAHSLALLSDGRVSGWGSNGEGQTAIPAALGGVRAISAGWFHSLALRQNGTLVAWGANGSGQSTPPRAVGPLLAVDGGGYHTLALRADGAILGWGNNSNGQITIPKGLGSATAISAGGNHSVALFSDGRVVCWGNNTQGECEVPDDLANVTAIAAGGSHTLVQRKTLERNLDLSDLGYGCIDPDGGEPSFPIECHLSLAIPVYEEESEIVLPDAVHVSGFELHGCWTYTVSSSDRTAVIHRTDLAGIPDGTYSAVESRPPDCFCTGGGQISTSCGSRATLSLQGNRIDIECSAEGSWPFLWGCQPAVRIEVAIDRPYILEWASCFTEHPLAGVGPCSFGGSEAGPGSMILPAPGTYALHLATSFYTLLGELRFRPLFPADVEPDGVVDAMDLSWILGNWGPVPIGRNAADVNIDGVVGGEDIASVLAAWGSDGSIP
jgi:hypothetical protein